MMKRDIIITLVVFSIVMFSIFQLHLSHESAFVIQSADPEVDDKTNMLLQLPKQSNESTAMTNVSATATLKPKPDTLVPPSKTDSTNPYFEDTSKKVSDLYQDGWLVSADSTCSSIESLSVIIMVISAPQNLLERSNIRATWGQEVRKSDFAKMVFLIGKSAKLQQELSREAKIFKDIVVTNNEDNIYHHLPLKSVSALKWKLKFCEKAQYLLKVDDDVFLNINTLPAIMSRLKDSYNNKPHITGYLAHNWKPFRNKAEWKYYIPVSLYPKPTWPDFTSGPCYMVSKAAVALLEKHVWDHAYFPLEDVFLTGILAEKLNIPRVSSKEFLNTGLPTHMKMDKCQIQKALSIHYEALENFETLLQNIHGPNC